MSFIHSSKFPTYEIDSVQKQDIEIWNNLKAGDKKALSFIYTKYFDNLYNYGARIAADGALAEDCIQDLFIELWTKREALSVRNIKYYLYKSLRRKIVYKLAGKVRHAETNDLSSFEIELSDKTHFLNQQINIEIQKRLTQLIGTLTTKQKEAIFLIYYDGLSYDEAASIMGLKIKTIYNLINLAISKLRDQKNTLCLLSVSFLLFA